MEKPSPAEAQKLAEVVENCTSEALVREAVPATAATTAPLERVLRRLEVTPEIARFVVVALVVVLFVPVKFWNVEEAVARMFEAVRPPLNAI